jgi:hypothetical protein
MGIFDKLFGGKSKETQTAVVESVSCPHAVLVARWETVADMGHEDKATRYMCEACHEEFSPEEGRRLRDTVAERMAASLQEITEEAPNTERT